MHQIVFYFFSSEEREAAGFVSDTLSEISISARFGSPYVSFGVPIPSPAFSPFFYPKPPYGGIKAVMGLPCQT